ncbi:MAG: C39 family peptidase [Firmicutes bacterium]|nr:C39 family peptidase [Bacillota bacterium]
MIKSIIFNILIIAVIGGVILFWKLGTIKNLEVSKETSTIELSSNYVEEAPILPEVETILEEKILNVPLLLQRPDLPTGCEIVSTAMMVQYNSINLTGVQLAREIPYDSSNPSLGYVGDPFTTNGWTIYPEALLETVQQYLPTTKVLEVTTLDKLKEQIVQEKPIVVWLSDMHGFTIHSVIITGYDQTGLFYNDPWTGEKNAWISNDDFINMWADQEYRALSY